MYVCVRVLHFDLETSLKLSSFKLHMQHTGKGGKKVYTFGLCHMPKLTAMTAMFIVSYLRLDYKSSSLTTRPRRLLSFNVTCSQVSGSGSLSLLFYYLPSTHLCPPPEGMGSEVGTYWC